MVVGEALGIDIGSALIQSVELVPGTEFGHLDFRGGPAALRDDASIIGAALAATRRS